MSLLMEALRKAEEAKRRMQQEEQAAARKDGSEALNPAQTSAPATHPALSLEPLDTDVTPAYIRDNFASAQQQFDTHEPVDDTLAAPPEPRYTPPPQPAASTRNLARQGQQRAAAASVFAAKQHPTRSRNTLTILVIAMLLLLPLGGGVLWYLQSTPSSSIGINPNIANYDLSSRSLGGNDVDGTGAAANPPPVTTTQIPEPPETESPSEPTANETVALAPELDIAAVDDAPAPPATATAVPDAGVAPAVTAGTQTSSSTVAQTTESDFVLEISRARATNQVNPSLVTAYDRLQAGDLAGASQLYQDVLNARPNNRDALLGLALVNLRQGALVSARELYARLLQLNPRDPLANTGLLQTMQSADPGEHESTLKRLIGEYPGVPQLTLALGNLYAAQQRWSEAQSAYYNALLVARRSTDGPVHPDYAFNLAVSLEQLKQPRAALDYYRQAQALARDVRPGFDPRLLENRLAYLSTQAQP